VAAVEITDWLKNPTYGGCQRHAQALIRWLTYFLRERYPPR
jgi:hypothetical protein